MQPSESVRGDRDRLGGSANVYGSAAASVSATAAAAATAGGSGMPGTALPAQAEAHMRW